MSPQNDEYFKQLDPLVAALKEQVPEAKYDCKALVFLLVQLLHFQEGALGKEVSGASSQPQPSRLCPSGRTPAHLKGGLQQSSTLAAEDATDVQLVSTQLATFRQMIGKAFGQCQQLLPPYSLLILHSNRAQYC